MIFKNALRLFKKRSIQLIGILVIVLSSSLLFTSLAYAMDGIAIPTFQFFDDTKREEFSIDTYPILTEAEFLNVMDVCGVYEYLDINTLKQSYPDCFTYIMDERMKAIEDSYNVTLELREIKEIIEDDVKFLVMNDMQEMNLSFIETGNFPNAGEVALTPVYMKINDLSIGDTITISGIDYQISGTVLFADYNMPMVGDSFILDNAKQTFVLFSDGVFDTIAFDHFYYYISGLGDPTLLDDVKDEFEFITAVTDTSNQMRSGAIELELKSGTAMSVGISLVMATFALVIVGIIVNRMLAKERNQLGLLKALGYKNSEITMPYVILLATISLPTLILGYFLGYMLAEPFMSFFQSFYLLPAVGIPHQIDLILMSIIIPFVFIVVMGYVVIQSLLKETALEMMSPDIIAESKLIKRLAKYTSKMNAFNKFKYALVFQSVWKFMVFAVGVVFAVFFLSFGLSFSEMMNIMVNDYYETVDYEYEAYCNYTGCPVDVDGEYTLELPAEYQDDLIQVIGMNTDSNLMITYGYQFEDLSGYINEKNAVANTQFLKTYNLDVDDQVLLTYNDQDMIVTIKEEAHNYMGEIIYVDLEYLQESFGFDDVTNKVYANTIEDEDAYFSVVAKSAIVNQAEMMSEYMNLSSIMIVGVSVVVGFIILYLIIGITIEENFYTISLLKVLGMSKREVNQLVLNPYLTFVILIYFVSIPVTLGLIQVMELIFRRYYGLTFPMEVSVWHFAFGFVAVLFMYFLGTYQAKKEISAISLQESMKLYQE